MFGTLHGTGLQKSFAVQEVKPVFPGREILSVDDIAITSTDLRKGDLLRVFKSVTSAKMLLEFDISFERDNPHFQDYQTNVDEKLWGRLFSLRLTARLVRAGGAVADGVLEPFSEQGMEGRVMWSIYDFHDNSYGSLHTIKNGDRLTVFSEILEGDVEWQGRVRLDEKPFDTGKNIVLVSFSDNAPSPTGLRIETAREVLGKTYEAPSYDSLKNWTRRNLPAQLLRPS